MILRLLGLPERHGWEADELLAREHATGWFEAPAERHPPGGDDGPAGSHAALRP